MAIEQAYPFATQDGKAIPLDVIKSKGIMLLNLTSVASSFTIPEGKEVAILLASTLSVIQPGNTLPDALISGTEYPGGLFIPSGIAVSALLAPGAYKAKTVTGAGTVYIQFIEKWAGLALSKQFVRK